MTMTNDELTRARDEAEEFTKSDAERDAAVAALEGMEAVGDPRVYAWRLGRYKLDGFNGTAVTFGTHHRLNVNTVTA